MIFFIESPGVFIKKAFTFLVQKGILKKLSLAFVVSIALLAVTITFCPGELSNQYHITMAKKIFKLLVLPAVGNMRQVIERFSFPIELTSGQFKDVEIIFQNKKTAILYKGTDLREFSFVWLCSTWRTRDLAYAIKLYLEHYKIPHTPVEQGTSKLTDHMSFSLAGISAPNTLFLATGRVDKFCDRIRDVCGYPLIIKDTKGSRGTDTVKVVSEAELRVKMKELPRHKKYLFQQYIPNEYDWGIMVANGKVVSGEKSYPCEGEFRNNACNGAKEVFIDRSEIPGCIKEMAIKASLALDLSWARADILVDKRTENYSILEVNRLPGITSKTSEVDGAFIFLASQI